MNRFRASQLMSGHPEIQVEMDQVIDRSNDSGDDNADQQVGSVCRGAEKPHLQAGRQGSDNGRL